MSDLFWLTDEQIERSRPFFPKSHGRPRVASSSSTVTGCAGEMRPAPMVLTRRCTTGGSAGASEAFSRA